MSQRAKFDQLFAEVDGIFNREAQVTFDVVLGTPMQRGTWGDLLEIGVYQGKCAGLMGLYAKPQETLVLVDVVDRFSNHMKRCLPDTTLSVNIGSSSTMKFNHDVADRSSRFIHVDRDPLPDWLRVGMG